MRFPRFWRNISKNEEHSGAGSSQQTVETNECLDPESEHLLIASGNEQDTVESSHIMENHGPGVSVNNSCVAIGVDDLAPPKPDIFAPPPYEETARDGPLPPSDSFERNANPGPPTYEEVQRLKALEAGNPPLMPEAVTPGMRIVRLNSMGDLEAVPGAETADEAILGTDLVFFAAFTGAFLFNVVGIVLLFCMCHTIAGRTGAMAGFGLSMAKWVFIFRNSPDVVKDANSWLLWLMMVLGFMIFARAILQYISAKRDWRDGTASERRQRLFVLY